MFQARRIGHDVNLRMRQYHEVLQESFNMLIPYDKDCFKLLIELLDPTWNFITQDVMAFLLSLMVNIPPETSDFEFGPHREDLAVWLFRWALEYICWTRKEELATEPLDAIKENLPELWHTIPELMRQARLQGITTPGMIPSLLCDHEVPSVIPTIEQIVNWEVPDDDSETTLR